MQWIRWTIMAALGLAPALCGAQESPSSAPSNEAPSQHATELIFGRREKGSYLGISAQPASGILRKQLGLHAGMGLVVKLVMPNSPAASAGIQPDDLLEKLDDQSLVNVEQLAVLVRARRPGDEVKLGVIREGKHLVLKAKLAERELDPLSDIGDEDELDQIWRAMPGALTRPPMPTDQAPASARAAGEQNVPLSISMLDGDRTFSVTFDARGHKTFIVQDRQGGLIFQGPINTQAERDAVPETLKPGMKSLLDSRLHSWRKMEQR